MLESTIVKVIRKKDTDFFEREISSFITEYSEDYHIEVHFSATQTDYTALIIARGK